MPEDLRTLMIAIRGWVLKCRRWAAEKPDPETIRLLRLVADKIDSERGKQIPTEKLGPRTTGRPMKKQPLG